MVPVALRYPGARHADRASPRHRRPSQLRDDVLCEVAQPPADPVDVGRLLRTIVDRTTAGVLADFHAAVDDLTDPVERLRRASLVYALRHATHRREAIVVNRDTASLEEPHRTELQNRRREHEHALRQIISDGVAAGAFQVDSPALASFAIREMCVSIARWFREDGPLPAEQVAEQYSLFALRIAGYAHP
jgi:hypothetical protein